MPQWSRISRLLDVISCTARYSDMSVALVVAITQDAIFSHLNEVGSKISCMYTVSSCSTDVFFQLMRWLFSLCVPLRQIFSTKVCSTTTDFLHKGVFHYDRFSPQRCVPLRQIFSTKVCSTTTDFLHKGVFHYDRFSPQSFLISSWQQRTYILLMLERSHEVIVVLFL